MIIDPKPHQSTHFLYSIENSPMDLSRKSQTATNTPNIMYPFPSIFQIHIMIICSPMLLIHFFCYFGKQKRFLLPGTYAFLTSRSLHDPIADCVPLNPLSSRMRAYNGKVYCVFMLLHCRLFDLPLPCMYMYTIIVYWFL